MSYSGFENEDKIIEALNGKKIDELNINLQQLIKESFRNYQGTIEAIKQAGQNKSDLKITIANESHTYSIKKGTGNSIHQEPIEPFLDFLAKNYDIDEKMKDNFKLFIWGDGTLDGKGNISDRLSAPQFKKSYPKVIEDIQNFFNGIKTPLIKRFLIEGVESNSSAEYVYYGIVESGVCCKSDKIVEWIAKNSSKGAISVGKLTFQAWNRNINGGDKSEKKRGVIQLKWGSIKDDIAIIANKTNMGTKEGTAQEIKFVKILNQKIDLSYWHTLKLDPNHHYAIRVISKKYGSLNESKILPKADAFIAQGHVDKEYLDSKEGFLDEKDMQKFNLQPINYSGISIKRADSKQYQIMKMSPSTFQKLFGSNILASGSSIYCNKEIEFIKNTKLLEAWGVREQEFREYFNQQININLISVTDATSKENLKRIKTFSNQEIAKIINTNKNISDFIFFGIGNFEEPFTAHSLFEQGEFKPNYIIPFTITTGSGRSKGVYTLVLKPKG